MITTQEETKTWRLPQLLFGTERDRVHLSNSNTSSTSKLELLWLHTKQNICRCEIFIEAPSLPVCLLFTFLYLFHFSAFLFICSTFYITLLFSCALLNDLFLFIVKSTSNLPCDHNQLGETLKAKLDFLFPEMATKMKYVCDL